MGHPSLKEEEVPDQQTGWGAEAPFNHGLLSGWPRVFAWAQDLSLPTCMRHRLKWAACLTPWAKLCVPVNLCLMRAGNHMCVCTCVHAHASIWARLTGRVSPGVCAGMGLYVSVWEGSLQMQNSVSGSQKGNERCTASFVGLPPVQHTGPGLCCHHLEILYNFLNLFFNFCFLIVLNWGVIYNVVLVSGVQQSDSVIYI